MESRLPLRRRWVPVLAVYAGAPVCAEYLVAYLSSTGDALMLLGGLLILGPLYGGAALAIREIALRAGRGWPARLWLAGCFGVLMPGLVDLSLFAPHNDEVAYWDALRLPTLIAPLGVSGYMAVTFAAGHVVMSIGAPLALLDALAPAQRRRPLLGGTGLTVVALLMLLAAVLIHQDNSARYGFELTPVQVLVVAAVAGTLAVAAFIRAPITPRTASPPAVPIFALAVACMLALDLSPATWLGLGLIAAVLAVACWLTRRWRWDPADLALLAAGAVVARTTTGFLTPIPDGVAPAAKLAQSSLLLLAAITLAFLLWRRHARGHPLDGPG